MRWGELLGLHRNDLDLDGGVLHVKRAVQEVDGKQLVSTPKSAAGVRTVSLPAVIIPDLRWHLWVFAEKGQRGREFVGPKGATPRRRNFQKFWRAATEKAGVPGLHVHDLRHTGSTLAASTGASLRELMERLGHSSPRAALIYQHATRDRDRAIANALDALARERKGATDRDDDGDDPPLVGSRTGT